VKRTSRLQRKTELRRGGYIRHKPLAQRSAYARRPRDTPYMLAVKDLGCCARHLGGCYGEVQADHAGRRGLGQKAADDTVIPICRQHHRDRGDFAGVFKKWDQAKMRLFLLAAIEETRSRLAYPG
jgi:hypothetical protein